jgi:hypothetical protein
MKAPGDRNKICELRRGDFAAEKTSGRRNARETGVVFLSPELPRRHARVGETV